MEDPGRLSLAEIRRGLDSKSFSSFEITQAFLARLEKHSDLNCFITVDQEYSLRQAREADKRMAEGEHGPLLGIPVAIKDILLTKDLRSTAASKMLQHFIPPYDATVVSRLNRAGSVTIGKTNMDEFAMGSSNENSAFGPVKNPWDKERVPGGSSGGSAAAVAARLAPLALGSDTGGSIRQPAALCGIYGIKPTYGRVSRHGVVAFASSLDQIGGFATTAGDLALLLQTISGHDPLDSTSMNLPVPDYSASLGKSIKGLRVGIPREYFVKGLNKTVEERVMAAVGLLRDQGAETVDISLPHTEAAVSVYYIIAPAEASSNLARYDGLRFGFRASDCNDLEDLYSRSRSEGFGTEVRRRIMVGTYVLSTGYYDAYYLQAQKVRTLITGDFRKAFQEKCDIIACPVTPDTAFKIGEKINDPLAMYLNDIFTIPVNLAGLPGMSVPCGFDEKGLPVGLQLIGQAWGEETLFKAAAALEQAGNWQNTMPSL